MGRRKFLIVGLTAGAWFLLLSAVESQQREKVPRNVTSERLEKILADMNITYKKSGGKLPGDFNYDYEWNNFKIRLINYDGKDLWIDALFPDQLTLDKVNKWNVNAKFSRAVSVRDKERQTVSLENQVDCLGGITDGMVRQFIVRFQSEVQKFNEFLRGN